MSKAPPKRNEKENKKAQKKKDKEDKKNVKKGSTSRSTTSSGGGNNTATTTTSAPPTPTSQDSHESLNNSTSTSHEEKDRLIQSLRDQIADQTIVISEQREEIAHLKAELEETKSGQSSGGSKKTTSSSSKNKKSRSRIGNESGEATEDSDSSASSGKGGSTTTTSSNNSKKAKIDVSTHRQPSEANVRRSGRSEEDQSGDNLTHIKLRSGPAAHAFSDLIITTQAGLVLSGQSGTVSCHASILSVRCPEIDKAIKEKYSVKGKKGKAPEIKVPKKKALDIKGVDVPTLTRMLDFLYAGDKAGLSLLTSLKPVEIILLTMCARKFSLDRMTWLCEHTVISSLTLENIVPMLKGANELRDERIRTFCIEFLLKPENFQAFVVKKELTSELGMDMFSELVTLNATHSVTDSAAELGACPASTFVSDFKTLYDSLLYADASISLDGLTIRFHKAVLCSASKRALENFSKGKLSAGTMEDVSECLDLSKGQRFYEKITGDAFRSLLEFVYFGNTQVDALSACLLIPWAKVYEMPRLQEICEKKIQSSVSDTTVVLKILSVTYLAIMSAREDMRDKLRKECISVIVKNLKDVNVVDIKKMDGIFALDLAVDLLQACQKVK